MIILVVGNGGREAALTWKIKQSPLCEKVFVAPGNAGTRAMATNVDIKATDIKGLLQFALREKIDLTVVGPEDPLIAGIADMFHAHDLPIFGPTMRAAQMEGSKGAAKQVFQAANVPTAPFREFGDYDEALAYLRSRKVWPLVIKVDGPALGKGVYVCWNLQEAEAVLRAIMVDKKHGDSGNKVVIEDCLRGPEISAHAFCDGNTAVLLPLSRDHKRAKDGDKGDNTGGMGAVCPVPGLDVTRQRNLQLFIKQVIVDPIMTKLRVFGYPFAGCLYPGLMLSEEELEALRALQELDIAQIEHLDMDVARVLETNVRLGDPETQVLMRKLKSDSDLLPVLMACATGHLAEIPPLEYHPGYTVCVVLASAGYPGSYQKGHPITGIEEAEEIPGVVVFHAGTAQKDGQLVTSGGRVLEVTALRDTLDEALATVYEAVAKIHFEGKQFRTDIGQMSPVWQTYFGT